MKALSRVLELARWRWTPFLALVGGSLVYVVLVVLLVPSRIGETRSLRRTASATDEFRGVSPRGGSLANTMRAPPPPQGASFMQPPPQPVAPAIDPPSPDSPSRFGFSPPLPRPEAPPPPEPPPVAPPPAPPPTPQVAPPVVSPPDLSRVINAPLQSVGPLLKPVPSPQEPAPPPPATPGQGGSEAAPESHGGASPEAPAAPGAPPQVSQ